MAIIYTYPDLGAVDGSEKLLVTDGTDENNTKTVTTAAYGAYINATYGGGGAASTIYLSDGGLNSDRFLNGNSGKYSLQFNDLKEFEVRTNTGFGGSGDIKLTPAPGASCVKIGDGSDLCFEANGDGITGGSSVDNKIYYDNSDLFIKAERIVSIEATDTNGSVAISNGSNSSGLRINNGVVSLTGSNNNTDDVANDPKNLTTVEYLEFYLGNTGSFTGNININTVGTISTGTWNADEIGLTYGGTGITSGYTQGDMLYYNTAVSTTELTRLPRGTNGQIIRSDGTIPFWSDLTVDNSNWDSLGTALSASNGGTGQTTYAQGDILYGNASGGLSKLSPGTADHVLTTKGVGFDPVWQVAPSATNIYTSGGTIGSGRLARITDTLTWQNGSIIRDVNSIDIVEVTQESDFGAVSGGNINLAGNTTYIVRGNVTCSNTLTVNGDNIAIIGYNRNLDKLIYTGTGNFINITDRDFTLRDLWLSATTTGSLLISGTNVIGFGPFNNGRDKVLEIVDCQFRNCFDVMDINGFDLVDISNTLFFYIQAPTIGLRFRDTSKLEISSCELIRWFDETTIATSPGGWATCSMIELRNNNLANFGAVNINGCIIHPQQTQNGIDIGTGSTTGFGTISSSAFVNTGLTTGKVFLPEIPVLLLPDYSQTATYNYDVFANQGILNSTSGSVSTLNNNTGVTPGATTAAPSSITIGGATPVQTQAAVRYSTVGTTGVTTYNGTKQVYCSIHASITVNNNGNSDTWTVSLHKNGTLLPGSEQQIELSAGGPSALNTGVASINYGTLFNNGDNIEIKIGSAGSSSCIIPDYQLVIRE